MELAFTRLLCAACILACLLPTLRASDAPGFVEGHLTIFSLKEVNLADDSARPSKPIVTNYADYPLIILSRDGKQEIARVTPDANGSYRVELPPGNYILDVQDRKHKHVRAASQPFTVVSNETIHVDMNIDTGIR